MRTLSLLPCDCTVAVTFAPEMNGEPSFASAPSPKSSTWSNSTDAPASAFNVATRSTVPSCTRYCLPPVAITANMEISPMEGGGLEARRRSGNRGRQKRLRILRVTCWRVNRFAGTMRGPRSKRKSMNIEEIRSLVSDDLAAVDRLIRARLKSEVALVDQVSTYIIASGGKRLRPLLVLLAARAAGYRGSRHVDAAAIIEFIHTATLLHDDVVDGSSKRRGQDTANEVWGNETSVLVGDFLYSRAFQMMADLDTLAVMRVMADATNTIAEGEVLQLLNAHDPETTEERYLAVIYRKTARLFEAGAEVAALLAEVPDAQRQAIARYGKHLGTAFQLIDDVLDYRGSTEQRGKNIGDDLAEGKPTLPLIYALQHGNREQRELIRLAVAQGGLSQLAGITEAIESTGGLEYTARLARAEADSALSALAGLPETPFSAALRTLARFAVERTH